MSEKYFAESIKNRKNRFSIEILYLFFHNISLLGYRRKIWYRPQGSKKTHFPNFFQLVYQYRDDLCYLHQRKSLFGEKKISNFFPMVISLIFMLKFVVHKVTYIYIGMMSLYVPQKKIFISAQTRFFIPR